MILALAALFLATSPPAGCSAPPRAPVPRCRPSPCTPRPDCCPPAGPGPARAPGPAGAGPGTVLGGGRGGDPGAWLVARAGRRAGWSRSPSGARCVRTPPGSLGPPLAAAAVIGRGPGRGGLGGAKVGALSYGGGFVIVPLMQHDAVSRYHWMTAAQFLSAVALGQITPGPVVQTVAVVGYAAAGLAGGLLAARWPSPRRLALSSSAAGTSTAYAPTRPPRPF